MTSSCGLTLHVVGDREIECLLNGRLLFIYVFRPTTPALEAPRPYFHPLLNRYGDLMTNFRPTDHPWHHGLSFTITRVGETNFWGGPTYRRGRGYEYESNHGTQDHVGFESLNAQNFTQLLRWRDCTGAPLLQESRYLSFEELENGWTLRWQSVLTNIAGRPLALGNYQSDEGLAGSHYTGLQFRGARDLLTSAEDADLTAAGGLKSDAAIHGQPGAWMEWACRHDGSLRRTRLRFECGSGPTWLFIRRANPQAALCFHREEPRSLAAGAQLSVDYRLTIDDGAADTKLSLA